MVFNSVVKELCFKHLQDIITMYVHDMTLPCYSLTTKLIPGAYFRFKLNSKKGQACLTMGKKSFTVFSVS